MHTDAQPYLPQDEQIRLLNNIKRTVGAGTRLGAADMVAEYWDDFLSVMSNCWHFQIPNAPFVGTRQN